MRSLSLATVLLIASAASAADGGPAAGREHAKVSLLGIEGVRAFDDATVPGAVRYACAQSAEDLESFFASRSVLFLPELVRRYQGLPVCHVFYEPTVPGFRASPDDDPITGVFGAVDPASFVVGREIGGGSLQILKQVLTQAPYPVEVTLTVNHDYPSRHWPSAVQRNFGAMPHAVQVRPSQAATTLPWAQDYLKAGSAGGVRKLLVPHRLFEGRAEDGEAFRPLLDGLQDGPLVRSKLSWEGGDLQLARSPRDPSKLLLFHGSAARIYWGESLAPAEYAYILRTELGADLSIDLSGLSGHVDYVMTLLPDERTVLLSEPVRGDAELAGAAARALAESWSAFAPPSVAALETSIRRGAPPERIRQRIEQVRAELAGIDSGIEPALAEELDAYTARYCPENSDFCFESEGRQQMFERNPALLRRLLSVALADAERLELTPRLLDLIEAQSRTEPWPREELLARKAREIERLGFRVVRVPHLVAEHGSRWPGVSYANSLVWGRRIFMPALGLGDYEQRLFQDLAAKLDSAYEIVPVPARHTLLRNGGVHCVFGLVRGQPPPSTTD